MCKRAQYSAMSLCELVKQVIMLAIVSHVNGIVLAIRAC